MRVFVLLLISIAFTFPALASQERAKRIGQVKAWSVFKHEVDGQARCWIATHPLAGSPDLGKKSTFVFYTLGKYEISVMSTGRPFPNESGHMKIRESVYPLFFRGRSGWIKFGRDAMVVSEMLKHNTAGMVSGNSGFAFSLEGFEEAALKAASHCEIAPFLPPV